MACPLSFTSKKKRRFQKVRLTYYFIIYTFIRATTSFRKTRSRKIIVPSGSFIRIQYNADGNFPVLAVRLQELFGMLETPTVCDGKIKLMMHLLSPAYRPVQVTQDLMSFWQNTYPEVRKELRMRYPRHSWPEDPFTAIAIRGAKKRK